MSCIRLLSSTITRPTLSMLAVLLLLLGLAFPSTSHAQDESQNVPCVTGLELPADLAELDLEGVQAALQELVDADPDATVTLLFEGEEATTIRADLLLAEEEALAALLEGEPVNVTIDFSQGEDLVVTVGIGVATAEDCIIDDYTCAFVELPAALAELDVAELRAALEEMLSADADATVEVRVDGQPAIVRADVLSGAADPVLEALLAGETVSLTLNVQDQPFVILDIAEDTECVGGPGGPPEEKPEPGTIPDNQQGGGKDTTPDNQQGGGDKTPDNQQDADKDSGAGDDQQGGVKPTTPDNQQTGGGKTPDNQQGGGGKEMVTKTFELTLNGTVPADQAFYVVYTPEGGGETGAIIFCGQVPGLEPEAECQGDGTVYRGTAQFAVGTVLQSNWNRIDEDTAANEPFHMTTETLDADMTNTAYYTFGKGTGAGDEQETPDNQQEGEKPDTGAGEVPDNQQEGDKDTDTDTGAGEVPDNQQDDQQGEMPEEMPDTGMGGLAAGATIPVGNAAAGLAMLVGAGYTVVLRR